MKRSFCLALAGMLALPAASQDAKNYGDTLIQRAMASHSELLAMALYAAPPKSGALSVLAASDLPAAEAAIANALTVQHTGQALQVDGADGGAPEAYLPMRDVAGEPIGSVGVTLARHPELLVLALHVNNASGSDYPIIASNLGRIGKKADGDDMRVVRDGAPLMAAYAPNKSRFGIELPMYDMTGARIGAMSVGFQHLAGAAEQALLRQALGIEAELRARIPTLARLIAPDA